MRRNLFKKLGVGKVFEDCYLRKGGLLIVGEIMSKERAALGKTGRFLDGDNGIDRSELDNRFERWYRGLDKEEQEDGQQDREKVE